MNSSIVPLSRHAGPLAVSLVVVLLILGCGDVQAQTADDTLSGAKDAQPVAAPAPPAGGLASFLRQVTVYALGDGYLTANSNHPSDKENLLRNFDTRSGALRLNYVEAAFEKKATDKGRLGFRTDFGAGPASDLVGAAEPGAHQWQYVQQAYVSVLAPIGSGLTVDVGKFVTPAGAEVIETQDNWNYSRSLLFAWAIPYYHAGVRASYAMGTKATATGFVFNGWNNVKDNNSAKSLGAQVVLGPAARVTFAGTWIGGPEQTDADSWRNLIDAILTTAVTPKVKLVLCSLS